MINNDNFKLNDNMIKLFDLFVSNDPSRPILNTFYYNRHKKEVIVTNGSKLIIVSDTHEIVSDYCMWERDFFKFDDSKFYNCANINDNDKLLNACINLKQYKKYKNYTIKVHPSQNQNDNIIDISSTVLVNNDIIGTFYGIPYKFPNYSYAINYPCNHNFILDVKETLKTCKDVLKKIKEYNKICKLKGYKFPFIDEKRIKLELQYNNIEGKKEVKCYLSDNDNEYMYEIFKELPLIFKSSVSSADEMDGLLRYINLQYLIDILESFKILKTDKIMVSSRALSNERNGLYPFMFSNDSDVKAYLMPINNKY